MISLLLSHENSDPLYFHFKLNFPLLPSSGLGGFWKYETSLEKISNNLILIKKGEEESVIYIWPVGKKWINGYFFFDIHFCIGKYENVFDC